RVLPLVMDDQHRAHGLSPILRLIECEELALGVREPALLRLRQLLAQGLRETLAGLDMDMFWRGHRRRLLGRRLHRLFSVRLGLLSGHDTRQREAHQATAPKPQPPLCYRAHNYSPSPDQFR